MLWPQRAARMAAAHRHLSGDHATVHLNFDPRAHGIDVGRLLPQLHRHKRPRAGSHVLPDLHRRAAVDHHQIQQPIPVQIAQRRTPPAMGAGDAGHVATFLPALGADGHQQRIRILDGQARHLIDIALGDKDIVHPVVVHIAKGGMPAGRGAAVLSCIGAVRRGAPVKVHIGPDRPLGPQHLKPLVAHGREVHIGPPVSGDIAAGDAHAPELVIQPAIADLGQFREHLPQLLMPGAHVVVPVVRDPQIGPPGARPVGEQEAEGAIARAYGLRLSISLVDGPVEVVDVAGLERALGIGAIDIVAKGQCREILARTPGSAEGGGPGLLSEIAAPVVRLERTGPGAAQDDVRADAQGDEVGDPVAVDVERVGAGQAGEGKRGGRVRLEGQRLGRRAIPEQGRRAISARGIELGQGVAVAVEHRDTTPDEMLPPAGVDVLGHRHRAKAHLGLRCPGQQHQHPPFTPHR